MYLYPTGVAPDLHARLPAALQHVRVLYQHVLYQQGRPLICMLACLLLYNMFVYPLSVINMDTSFVTCAALRSIKTFFFCGMVLWCLFLRLCNCNNIRTFM